MPSMHKKSMSNLTLIAITTENSRCLGQFPTGPAVPSPLLHMAKEELGRFPEAHNPGIAGRDQSSRSPGSLRALLALAALGQGALPLSPSSYCRVGSCLLTASRFQTPTNSVLECFQPAFLTSNLWKKNTVWHLTPEKLPICALHSITHKSKNWTAHVMYQANAISLFAKTLAAK